MFDFVSGLLVMGFLVAALFFLRYWRQTHDGLFAAFSAAFALLALNQTLLVFTHMPVEERSPLYLLRLAAFTIIIVAVVVKNRRGRRR